MLGNGSFLSERKTMKQTTEMKEKRKIKPRQLVLSILAGFLALILLLLLGVRLWFRLPAWEYYHASEQAFVIPGLSDGFVPQGLDYDGRTDLFWVSGYMDDGSASPIYLVGKSDRKLQKTIYLADEEGKAYSGHAGGVAVDRDHVYIAGGGAQCILVYSCDQMMTAENGASVSALGRISTKFSDTDSLRVSAVSCDGRYLYAVEFFREPDSPTPENHKLTAPSGERCQALALAYSLTNDVESFSVEHLPSFAMALPDAVQGMYVDDNQLYLSSSWGAGFSHIYEYSIGELMTEGELSFMGSRLPLYYLDLASAAEDYKLPPMAEEIVMADGKLYTMCESASNKYLFGKLTSSRWCYATDLTKMK